MRELRSRVVKNLNYLWLVGVIVLGLMTVIATSGGNGGGGIPEGLIEYIKASNTDADDQFGFPVALSADGNTLAVGAFGEDSNARGVKQPGDLDYFTSQSDNSAMNSGAVYIFTRSGDTWSQQAYLKASNADPEDYFGQCLSISDDGNTLAVGAGGEDGNGLGGEVDNSVSSSGAAYIFSRVGDTWSYDFYIKSSNPDADDWFGTSLSLSGDGNTLAVGARGEDSGVASAPDDNSAEQSGAVYIFVKDVSFWYQQAYLKAPIMEYGDAFGSSVSLSDEGDTLMVGVPGEDSGTFIPTDNSLANSGAFYIFTRSGIDWDAWVYLKPSVRELLGHTGHSVALSGNGGIAVAGGCATGGSATSEAVYVFSGSGVSWIESPLLVEAPNFETGDLFGYSLAFSGLVLATGAPDEDSAATGIGGDQDDNSATSSGAVYIYNLD